MLFKNFWAPFQRFDSVGLRLVCEFAFLTFSLVMLLLLVQEQCFEKHCCSTPRESTHFALLPSPPTVMQAASSPWKGSTRVTSNKVGVCPLLGQNKNAFFATNGSALPQFRSSSCLNLFCLYFNLIRIWIGKKGTIASSPPKSENEYHALSNSKKLR